MKRAILAGAAFLALAALGGSWTPVAHAQGKDQDKSDGKSCFY